MRRIIGLAVILAVTSCGRTTTTTGQEPPEPELTLREVEVLGVDLSRPVQALDAGGKPATWNTAQMVRLSLDGVPDTSLQLRLYVGEQRIGEHGGWEDGLYFWVYDPALAARLNGQEIGYSYDRGERKSLGRKLEIGAVETRVAEDSLFPGRKQ